ncbi:MAG: hypothetical protein KIT85_01170 [Pseudolabrys sp.]|nr:hypothetical protein [Pseudolabrys sp.]
MSRFGEVLCYRMDIYMAFNSVQMTIKWPDEKSYRRGRDFLRAMGCGSGNARDDFDPKNRAKLLCPAGHCLGFGGSAGTGA